MKSNFQSAETLENDLMKTIRGYSGYQVAKSRQQTDRRLREFFSEQLKNVEKQIASYNQKIEQSKSAVSRETFTKVSTTLKTVLRSLQNPVYQISVPAKIFPGTLQRLYEYEIQLKKQVQIFSEEVQEMGKVDLESEGCDFMNHLFDLIDGINQTLSERELLILGEMN
jgi:vacuolar-type H+-ATPase subunit H